MGRWDAEQCLAPEPEFESDRGEWLVTCPYCLQVVLGEDPREAMDAWVDHNQRDHPRLPESELHGLALLDALINPQTPEGAWAVWAVRDYWTPGRFTGAHFDHLGSRDDGSDPNPDVITSTDIVAVSMLDVNVPAVTSIELLGFRSDEIRRTLHRVTAEPLHQVDRAEIEAGSPAVDLWNMLRNRQQRMGPTKTSKLLARKRPHLLPVWDRRVAFRLDLPDRGVWTWWWNWWASRGHVTAVEDLRRAAAVQLRWKWPSAATLVNRVSLLRVVDVAVWRYDQAVQPTTSRLRRQRN